MKLVEIHIHLSPGFIWLTDVMEKAEAPFQMKTNLQDALSMDIHYIHYNVMQRSKNRNKTWYLRQDLRHTQIRVLDTHRHTNGWWVYDVTAWWVFFKSSRTQVGQKEKKGTFVLARRQRSCSWHNRTMNCVSRGGCYLVNSYCELHEENQWKKESYHACWLSLVIETRPQYRQVFSFQIFLQLNKST